MGTFKILSVQTVRTFKKWQLYKQFATEPNSFHAFKVIFKHPKMFLVAFLGLAINGR